MATTDVDIVNLALGHLGDRANVSSVFPSDGSAQGDHANRFYAQVRDQLLERFTWKFATRRETLAERSDLEMSAWRHIYAEPNHCLRILAILPEGYITDKGGVQFDTETDALGAGIILTNAKNATCRFIARVNDPGRFTPGFVASFSWALASVLAGPIIKGETGRAEAVRCLQAAEVTFAVATGMSAANAHNALDFIPSIITSRGGGVGHGIDVESGVPTRDF